MQITRKLDASHDGVHRRSLPKGNSSTFRQRPTLIERARQGGPWSRIRHLGPVDWRFILIGLLSAMYSAAAGPALNCLSRRRHLRH